ncbi:hypothetical protein [Mycobacterium sp.]|uniref:hypothetical protein n=1 Tax=Mycobacterium sp. TaxID=1785 RepID=UPI00261268EC|nr:hypothetical protein [Mycobacterium sp.]
MARLGLFRKVQPPPGPGMADVVSRLQDNVTDAVNRLTQDDDLVRAPAVNLSAAAPIPSGSSVVVYRGGAGQVLTLPPASAQGASIGQVLFVLNATASSVTIARTGADTVGGGASVSLSAGALMILASDGVGRWCVR